MTAIVATVNDTLTIFVRQVLPSLRQPAGLVFGMLQPVVFLALFGPLLGGMVEIPGMDVFGGADAWSWFLPGVLIMLALFGTSGTGYLLLTEMQTGSHERLLVTPLNRAAMLAGRTLNDVATLIVQAVLIVGIMIPFGVRFHPLGVAAGLILLAVLGVAMGALSHALAIACRSQQETFYMVQQTLLFPLLFLSGLILPLDMGPPWMKVVGAVNPLTYVVDAERALFNGSFANLAVAQGVLAALALATVGIALGTRGMRRANA